MSLIKTPGPPKYECSPADIRVSVAVASLYWPAQGQLGSLCACPSDPSRPSVPNRSSHCAGPTLTPSDSPAAAASARDADPGRVRVPPHPPACAQDCHRPAYRAGIRRVRPARCPPQRQARELSQRSRGAAGPLLAALGSGSTARERAGRAVRRPRRGGGAGPGWDGVGTRARRRLAEAAHGAADGAPPRRRRRGW